MDSPEAIMQRIADGDKAAEQELIDHFWRPLYYIVLKQSGDPDLSQDIVQDSLLIVINNARNERIEKPDAIATYVRKVAESVLITHYRKEQRRKTDTADNLDLTWPDQQNETASRLNQQQIVALVKQVTDELQIDRDKALLKAYFFYGKNKQQICAELDLTPEHFDRVLHRAKQRLKQSLAVKLNVNLAKDSLAVLLNLVIVVVLITPDSKQQDNSASQLRETPANYHLLNTHSAHFNNNDVLTKPEEG